MGQDLGVALVGFGMAGQVFHAPLVSRTRGLSLRMVVSSNPAKVLAAYPGTQVCQDAAQAFADESIDLVIIATPNATHAPLALAALAHGKHVVVDKPFALDVAEAQQVADAADAAGRLLSVFHNRRWDSDFLTLRALVEGGTLGEVVQLHSHFDRYRPTVPDRWREHDEPGSGLFFDLGPHLIDQALQLFGTPLAVHADLACQRRGARVDDYFQVTLRYARLRVVLHGSALVPASSLRFAVHGTHASFIKHGTDPQEAALKRGDLPDVAEWGRDPQPAQLHAAQDGGDIRIETIPSRAGDYPHYYRAIETAIRSGGPPPVTTEEALAAMGVLQLARDSARLRRELRWG